MAGRASLRHDRDVDVELPVQFSSPATADLRGPGPADVDSPAAAGHDAAASPAVERRESGGRRAGQRQRPSERHGGGPLMADL